MVPTLCRIDTDPLLKRFTWIRRNAPCYVDRCRGPTDPRNAGKAPLYALNKIPDAESACAMKGQSVSRIQKIFQFMEHFAVHKLHNYQLSQEITSRLLMYLNIVTLCIDYRLPMHIRTCPLSILHAPELRKQRSACVRESSRQTGRIRVMWSPSRRHRHGPAPPPAGPADAAGLVT